MLVAPLSHLGLHQLYLPISERALYFSGDSLEAFPHHHSDIAAQKAANPVCNREARHFVFYYMTNALLQAYGIDTLPLWKGHGISYSANPDLAL